MAVNRVLQELGFKPRSPAISRRPTSALTDKTHVTFKAAFEEAEGGQFRQQMESLLGQIIELSDKLSGSLSRENLNSYLGAVRSFLSQVQDRSTQLRRDIRQGNLLSIRRVNESLGRLGELLLEREQDRIRLLDELGEIKGLLLSIRV